MKSRRRWLRLAGDGFAAIAALWSAFLVRLHVPIPGTRGLLPGDRLRFLSREWLVVLLLQFATLYFFGFYDAPAAAQPGRASPAAWPAPPPSRRWP